MAVTTIFEDNLRQNCDSIDPVLSLNQSTESVKEGATDNVDTPDPITSLMIAQDSDFFLFSGPIERGSVDYFINKIEKNHTRKNASLILCTYGGDADAAFILTRYLKNKYEKLCLYIFGMCKSAGTLIALGANEIVMASRGELGPLDVQLIKDDVLSPRSSGLDLLNSIQALRDYSSDYFESHFLMLKQKSGLTISTKIAADIACNLAIGLISPIMSQIDPIKLGEVQRSMNIAYEYGKRLNPCEEVINKLIMGYPTHSFVIDFEEAKSLLGNVRAPEDDEIALYNYLANLSVEKFNENVILSPSDRGVFQRLGKQNAQEKSHGTDQTPNENENDPTPSSENSTTDNTGSEGVSGEQKSENLPASST